MEKHIKIYNIVLLLLIPFFSSCSLIELDNNDNYVVKKISCESKQYKALVTADQHKIKGKAQIYKGNMQGKKTANCDVLDMNSFTAAHSTLPLPSHIKITNVETNKSVVVKVNHRIAMQGETILQVTPAIANVLGAKSSFPVSIKVIPTDIQTTQPTLQQKRNVVLSTQSNRATKKNSAKYYIVIGTYTSQEEALTKFTRLSSIGINNATMETRKKRGKLLHMVRIGPFYQQDEIDIVKNRLQNDGLVNFTVVRS
jgi:rare lipoprotein A